MGLVSNHRLLLGFTLVLSLTIHGLALSYIPLEKWWLAQRNSDEHQRPLIHIKLSKITTPTQQTKADTTDNRTSQRSVKQAIQPKKPSSIKKRPVKAPLIRKSATTKPKTTAVPVTKHSPATPSAVESIEKPIQPKELATTDHKAKVIASLPVETTTIEPPSNTRPTSNTVPQMPDYLNNPKPFYPTAAKRRGIQGLVLLEVTVSPTGNAAKVTVKKSSGYKLLDRAASDAVASWQFIPASENGEEIEAVVEVPIRFELVQG